MEPAISLDRVTFGYEEGAPVIKGITVSAAHGEVCALIGPNAAGKSTLLKLMLGQLEPWSGSVHIGQENAGRLSAKQLAQRISHVPQRSSVGFSFTVEQVVRLGRYAVGVDHDAVAYALEVCDLLGVRHRPYPLLSVGQQQRVLLARAIAQCAGASEVMLLDEPVTAMDLEHVHRTMSTLTGLARQGLAVVVVLHDINLAARYADSIWLLDKGRVVTDGPWGRVLTPEVLEQVYRVSVVCDTSQACGRPYFITGPRSDRSNKIEVSINS